MNKMDLIMIVLWIFGWFLLLQSIRFLLDVILT